MKAAPINGCPINAATPAEPAPSAAGREEPAPSPAAITETRAERDTDVGRAAPRFPSDYPGQRSRKSPVVRIGASRQGKRSSWPAESTTSPVMSARVAPRGKVRQG